MPGATSSFLLLVVMPGATSSFLLLVVMPGATSSFLLLVEQVTGVWQSESPNYSEELRLHHIHFMDVTDHQW